MVRRPWLALTAITGIGLALRLLVWRWHMQYPLGGDEHDYFYQALALLQGKGYRDLALMRPPLYPVFLAGLFRLIDSQVQRIRLVQALISTATIPAVWWLAREFVTEEEWPRQQKVRLLAAALAAFSYTLAANAAELLTETMFVAGLTGVLALLLPAPRRLPRRAAAAGLLLGLLVLLRSVALPLAGLGAAWLWVNSPGIGARRMVRTVVFLLGMTAVVAPWTVRNAVRYHGLILVDTTGAENLWLDNDPRGREPVKRQLLALGEDRVARQRLATARGVQAIAQAPGHFVIKGWEQARLLVALEYFDDLRHRPTIWVSPFEVWARLLLGDGLWLLLLLGGTLGLWLHPRPRVSWLVAPWVLYVVLTNLMFHVELRYRLPLYPVLLPYTAWTLLCLPRWRRSVEAASANATLALLGLLLVLHRPYPTEGVWLARKHWALWRGHPQQALALDPSSALARVALARQVIGVDERRAQVLLEEAIKVKPDHPYGHLLRGDLLRRHNDLRGAGREFTWETHSLEDLQHWSWTTFASVPPTTVTVGTGDLGWVEGFYAPEQSDRPFRWSTGRARVRLAAPTAGARLVLQLASERPGHERSVRVTVRIREVGNGERVIGESSIMVGSAWQPVVLDPMAGAGPVVVELDAPTFRPRERDRRDDDNRALGVRVGDVGWQTPHATQAARLPEAAHDGTPARSQHGSIQSAR
ncbi:MAG: hypothetical protein NVS4B8_05350 [Herpetosiphon sp.]